MFPVNRWVWLGSQSESRRLLLEQARIPYKVVQQLASEVVDDALALNDRVGLIARQKGDAVVLPDEACQIGTAFVMTADTLVQLFDGQIVGKPQTLARLREVLVAATRGPVRVATGFYCDRRVWLHDRNAWSIETSVEGVVVGEVVVSYSSEWIDRYSAQSPELLHVAGGLMVEGFGAQFVRSVHGSYSGIMGLPLCEVREALESLGFFSA